jgi:Rrf2 family protein
MGVTMKISTKGRYGLRSLVDLAINSTNGQVSLINIANRNKISIHYLEQVFSSLKKSGIVKSVKGAGGGYVLGDSPSNIKVSKIIRTLEGDYQIAQEEKAEGSEYQNVSQVIDTLLWNRINQVTDDILENITLEDLKNEYDKLSQNGQEMYYI